MASLSELDILLPGFRAAPDLYDQVVGTWGFRLPTEFHPGFGGEPVALAVITAVTGAGRIRPPVHAATGFGDDMVYGEITFGHHAPA